MDGRFITALLLIVATLTTWCTALDWRLHKQERFLEIQLDFNQKLTEFVVRQRSFDDAMATAICKR